MKFRNPFATIFEYVQELDFGKNAKEYILSLLFPVGMVLLLLTQKKGLLKSFDQHSSFWLITLGTLVFLAGFLPILPRVYLSIKELKIPKLSWALVLLIIALGAKFAFVHIEPMHRVQSDESIFLATAQNMYHHGIAATCDEGDFDKEQKLECRRSATSFKTKVLSAFYAYGMPLFGKNLKWIFHFQGVLYLLSMFLFFLALRLWTGSDFLSLTATAFLSFTPTILFQYRSASVEPLYIFLGILALVQLYFLVEWKSSSLLQWASWAALLALFSQTRQETAFCLASYFAVALPVLKNHKGRLASTLAALFIGLLPVFFLVLSYRGYSFQGGEFKAHGFSNFIAHIKINFAQMTQEVKANGLLANPFLKSFTWLSLIGMIGLLLHSFFNKKSLYYTLFLFLYHIQSYMIFENVSGDYTININQRYSLVILPTMAFLIGWLFDTLRVEICRIAKVELPPLKTLLLTLPLIGFAFFQTQKHTKSLEANIMYKRNHLTNEERVIHQWMDKNPGRKLFVYDRPWHFIGYGISSMSYHAWTRLPEPEKRTYEKEFEGEIYYVRGLKCFEKKTYHRKAVETRNASLCEKFERTHGMKLVLDHRLLNSYPLRIHKILVGESPLSQLPIQLGEPLWRDSAMTVTVEIRDAWNGQGFLLWGDQKAQTLPATGTHQLRLTPPQPGLNLLQLKAWLPGRDTLTLWKKYVHRDSTLSLTQVPVKESIQSWGSLGINRTVQNKPLQVNGLKFAKGLGTHASSKIVYQLPQGYQTLRFGMGLDDEDTGGDGVRYQISGDGKPLFESAKILPGKVHLAEVPISGIQQLILSVDSLADKDFDHADWLEPVLIKE